jgi:hypothetical protein
MVHSLTAPGSLWPLDDLTSPTNVGIIIDIEANVMRNLLITQSYHELAGMMAQHLDCANVHWCAFATWASKQAGAFIRNEEIPTWLRRLLRLNMARPDDKGRAFALGNWIRGLPLAQYIRRVAADVSDNIAEGNHMVYARLAPLFADFLPLIRDQATPDPEALANFIANMGYSPAIGYELRDAFTYYYQARFETQLKLKAELIFLANTLVGVHEQRRLQLAIANALASPIDRLFGDLNAYISRHRWMKPARRPILGLCKWMIGKWMESLTDKSGHVATEVVMTFATPGMVLRLGDDVPQLPGGASFPYVLQTLTHSAAPEIIKQYDLTPNTLQGSGAYNWAIFSDRMHFIMDYFRSRQQSLDLLNTPFNAQQVEAMKAGRIPHDGPL